jgi:hypothetical protein
MKFDSKFQNQRMSLIRRMSRLIELTNAGYPRCKKIPKLVGTQVFLKRYERLPQEKKEQLIGEYKRRLIRFQWGLHYVTKDQQPMVMTDMMNKFYVEEYIYPELAVLFRKMSDVDGSRDVPLTPNMSTLKRG